MRIYAGSDHAGFSLRKRVVERLRSQGKDVVDVGTDSDTACDYPEFAYAVASKVRNDPASLGILVCATGQGMAMSAGKVRGIRAVAPFSIEGARLSRIDNNANVLCLAGRMLSEGDALAMVDTWLSTSFAGGRHARRIAKVAAIETASAVAFVTESERLQLASRGFPAKLFNRDVLLFDGHPIEKERLEWAHLPQVMTDKLPELASFADHVRQTRLKDVVLLFDGAEQASSKLCSAWGTAGMRLHVLPSGDAEDLARIEETIHLDSTLVLLFSTTPQIGKDLQAQEQRLWSRMLDHSLGNAQRTGQHFAAVTTAGTGLAQVAEMHRYARLFIEAPGAQGPWGALGFAGLVPALLAGVDPARLLARAKAMADACHGPRLEENPGASLGILLGAMAKHGRCKLNLLASKTLEPLVPWVSHLLAQATLDGHRSLVVLGGEPLKASYPTDRIFVHLQAAEDPLAIPQEAMEALHIAGQPYIQIAVADKLELGAEIFRWQIAATVAALVLGASPFAEPALAALGSPGQAIT